MIEKLPLEYKEISGVSNKEVRLAINDADFIVDQLYSDTPLAAFATEAAFSGVPSVVGGYCWEQLKKYLPPAMEGVSLTCLPSEVKASTKRLILSHEVRAEIGRRANLFVSNYLAGKNVARRVLKVAEGHAPDEWRVFPSEVDFLCSVGQSEEVSRRQIRGLLENFGEKSLGLGHNKKLLRSVVSFAWGSNDGP
jgi:hypothetical protein